MFYGQGEGRRRQARLDGARKSDRLHTAINTAFDTSAGTAFVLDGGKLQPVVGTFASRRFSNRNPLIGAPDGYTLEYPLGVELSGETSSTSTIVPRLVTLPPTHSGYVPAATPRLRPAIGAGVTPIVGRAHRRFVHGRAVSQRRVHARRSCAMRAWSHYHQRVFALDAQGLRAGIWRRTPRPRARSYEVPGPRRCDSWATRTMARPSTPSRRGFSLRRARSGTTTRSFARRRRTGRRGSTDFVDGELGVGYRATARRRCSRCRCAATAGGWLPGAAGFLGQGGPAFAIQVSQVVRRDELVYAEAVVPHKGFADPSN